jgi:membrane protein DedA with SNARE-associated domain
MLPMASLTEPLVNFATGVIDDLGLAGVFVLMLLESACIPIPSEATMMFAGFNISSAHHPHDFSLVALIVVGSVANLVGSWIAYAAGYYGRVDLLEKNRFVHVSPKYLATTDRWFQRHGNATVFLTRMLPIVRTFVSLPAGIAKMPFWRFSALTLAGCVPWVTLLAVLGQQAGDRWKHWRHSLEYVDYTVGALIVVGIVYWIVRRRRGPGAPATESA